MVASERAQQIIKWCDGAAGKRRGVDQDDAVDDLALRAQQACQLVRDEAAGAEAADAVRPFRLNRAEPGEIIERHRFDASWKGQTRGSVRGDRMDWLRRSERGCEPAAVESVGKEIAVQEREGRKRSGRI